LTTADRLLERIATLGVRLTVENGRLKFRAPKGVMTADLVEQMKASEADLLHRLDPDAARGIPRVAPRDRYPLSHAQQRLWVLDQLEGSSAAYRIPLVHRIEGRLDVDALREAFAGLVRRHETMRTVFTAIEGVPYQTVLNGIDLPFDVIDLSREPDPEQAARTRVEALVARPFDVARGPLFRVELARLGHERYLLTLAMHHIISDGVSITVLAREIGELYTANRAGCAAALPDLPIQYRDFAAWQNAYLQHPDAEAHRAYWLRTLAAPLPIVELPTDAVRPVAPSFAGREELFSIDREVSEPFRRLCQAQGASVFMGLVAAVTTLMHRYSGAEDLIIGSPIAGRDHVDLDHAIGVFINTLALRTTIQPHLTFKEVMAATRRTVVDAFDHRLYPFDRLVQDLDVARDFSRSPVFDAMVILQNQHAEDFALDELRVSPVYQHSGASKVDLTFTFHERGHAIALGLEYRTDLFHRERIRRMGGHLITLIESAVRDPATPVGRLNILTPSERRLLVDERNQTTRTYRLDRTVLDLFAERVREQPTALAVTCGAESLTYETLDTRSSALAARLRSRGAGPGQIVGFCVERSVDMLVGLLGILKSGAAYVPLDPAFPPARLELMLRDSRALLLVTQAALVHLIGAGADAAERLLIDDPTSAVHGETPASRSAAAPSNAAPSSAAPSNATRSNAAPSNATPSSAAPGPDDLAYVIYTSGSTGTPKGVQVTHRNLANFLLSMADAPGMPPSGVMLAVTTLSFDIAGLELYLPLITGARIVVATREETTDGARLARLLTSSGATVMQATPATWRMLRSAGWTRTPGLTVLCGGEALPGRLAADLLCAADDVWNLYGPTETTIWSTLLRVEDASSAWETIPTVPIGRPIGNTTVYVLDREANPVPQGCPGDLYIGGEGVARGYLNLPALTADRFVPDPFSSTPGSRLYRTGDRASYRDDGSIDFLGRDDHQVKLRGFRIETGEIESVLLRHPSIREAVVVAAGTDDDRTIVAYVVGGGTEDIDRAVLRTHLAASLPDYMIPSLIVPLDRIPLTPNGKCDRRALPRPDRPAILGPRAIAAPRDERERTIRDVWAAILEIDEVGIHDNFFELGGHSLRATRAAYELQRVLGVHVDLIDLFKAPTIAGLGERLVARRPAGADAILPIPIPLPAHGEVLTPDDEGTAPLTAEERELLMGEDV
jgi:amino acid adenylation domain-containing protein